MPGSVFLLTCPAAAACWGLSSAFGETNVSSAQAAGGSGLGSRLGQCALLPLGRKMDFLGACSRRGLPELPAEPSRAALRARGCGLPGYRGPLSCSGFMVSYMLEKLARLHAPPTSSLCSQLLV